MKRPPHRFSPSQIAERRFATALRKVARIVAGMVKNFIVGSTIRNEQQMLQLLHAYEQTLELWAERVSADMMESIARHNAEAFKHASPKRQAVMTAQNRKAFQKNSAQIHERLRSVIGESPVGAVTKLLQHRQVTLIKSLPREAGERAQRLARIAMMNGSRAAEVAEELARTEEVTLSRATLIARTEVAKANAALTQARAESVGAYSYQWNNAEDADVRESHRVLNKKPLNGQVFRFDDPPTLDDGMTGNPGEFPNCRCFAIPLFPGE